MDPLDGGGRVVGEVCHFIDFCSYLIDSDPVTLCASRAGGADSLENISIAIEYANGSVATVVYTVLGGRRMPKELVEAFSSDSSVRIENFRTLEIFKSSRVVRTSSFSQRKGFDEEIAAFLGAVATSVPAISLHSMVQTTLASFAVEESLAKHAPVLLS